MDSSKHKGIIKLVILCAVVIAAVLVASTIWIGQSAKRDTEDAVHSVSLLYLDELAGRREQVVANNLESNIDMIQTAIGLITDEDKSSIANLQDYQARMKTLFHLERFAFVDEDGTVYTAMGIQKDIDQYNFDYKKITEPEISVKNEESKDKKAVIAVPVKGLSVEGNKMVACFMQQEMSLMLKGVSMDSQSTDATFCNIYTENGVALTNTVLGGQAPGTNLLQALKKAEFDPGYSYDKVVSDFKEGKKGVASFTYGDVDETLSYVPVEGTDWMLSYLIRESVISDKISAVSEKTVMRSIIQSILIAIFLLALFIFLYRQTRRSAEIALEKETAEAESRIKQEELEARIELQEQLLEQERQQARQNNLITALASDYKSVYYLELDKGEGICYQENEDLEDGLKAGEHFDYMEAVTAYADKYITDQYHDEFMEFIQPDSIRKGLADSRVISYRYVVNRNGRESYEMVRFAGVRHPEDRGDGFVHSVGACFTDVDEETRMSLAKNEALAEALKTAEDANKAKTTFLSNMSHEIRTPMNAIIGLNNIAINDEETSEKTKEYLAQMGDSADHLLNLINDILDMSRIESGRMTLKSEEFSMQSLLNSINTMLSGQCQEKGIDYQCYVNGQMDDYYIGDNMKLRQVLINILSNAVKFTPEGRSVEFSLERIAEFENNATLRFTIKDTGIGMSKDFLPHIFDTFSQENSSNTSKYGSSGLGMAITKNIIDMMNGNIEVESEKGEGSTFKVTVTLLKSDHIDDEHEIEVDPHELSVLVIDDDPVACEHARLVMEKAGIAVDLACSGNEAVEKVQLRHARRDPYNLILVDWQMPEMDGIETTRKIREIAGNESAIIILTAYRWDDVLEEALGAGVDSFIAKPLFANTVIEEYGSAVKKKNIEAKKKERKADLEGRHILMAEDVKVNADIMKLLLGKRGMEVDVAENGRIAVDMFAEHPEGYYDAVLMDMRMPEMDGLEATRTIRGMDRKDAKDIPIIALTANAFDEDVQRSLQSGHNAHLSKPVDPNVLFETLEGLIKD